MYSIKKLIPVNLNHTIFSTHYSSLVTYLYHHISSGFGNGILFYFFGHTNLHPSRNS